MKTISQQNTVTTDSTLIIAPSNNASTIIATPKKTTNSIPEIPERFRVQPTYKRKKKIILFTPSTEDSVEYNLIVRPSNNRSPLHNNVVSDYLNPINRSDKQWINTQELKAETIKELQKEKASEKINQQLSNLAIQADSLINEEFINSKDSIAAHTEHQKTVDSNHFLSNSDKDVISGLLIFIIAVVGFIRVSNFKYLKELFSSLIYSQSARKLTTTFSTQNQIPSFILNVLFILNASVFIYLYLSFHNMEYIDRYGLWLIPINMLGILLYFTIKTGLYRYVGYVFDKTERTKEYLLVGQRHSKIAALMLLPFIAIIPYIDISMVPTLLKIGILGMISLYLIQITRGLRLILTNIASFFYLFLYLCALEIFPLIIMYSIVKGNS